ncbi:putative protein EIN4-like [Capsicum annuum]|nr:putative protein EIN4-like [Capsicum annuum]
MGGTPHVLNIWMYECCSEVYSAITERIENVISLIFNWKVVGIKFKYEKFMGVCSARFELNDDESGFSPETTAGRSEILKKAHLLFDASTSQHTKRRRTVLFDSATVEEQVYQKTPFSVSTRTVPTQKIPSSDSERVHAEKTTPSSSSKSIVGETVKSIDIDSADDPMDGHYFDWNHSPIQEQSEDVEGCCEDIATTRPNALVKFVVNQNSANPNVETPSTVHINKDHMVDYSSTLSESAQVELDAILEGIAAPVDDLPIEVVPPSEVIVNKHDISDSQLPPDFSDAVVATHQTVKNPTKRIRTRSKVSMSPNTTEYASALKQLRIKSENRNRNLLLMHIDVIFYHLRKKSKLRNDQDYMFTTTNCFFKNYIVKTYSNYYEDDTDTIITTQQDYAQSVDVVLNEDAITNIIKGYCMPSGLPWHQVDEVYVPINCNDKFYWVLAVIALKDRRIRVYVSLSSLRNMESINEINKLAAMLPTYLSDNEFFEETSHKNWTNLEAYRDKITQRTQF